MFIYPITTQGVFTPMALDKIQYIYYWRGITGINTRMNGRWQG
jgi:hypothetical protein